MVNYLLEIPLSAYRIVSYDWYRLDWFYNFYYIDRNWFKMLVSCATDVKLHEYPSYELAHIYRPAVGSNGHIRNVSWCKDGSIQST